MSSLHVSTHHTHSQSTSRLVSEKGVDTIFHVFVADHCNIDYQVYKLWLQGKSVMDAAKLRNLTSGSMFGMNQKQYMSMLHMDVQDQYRVFESLESGLRSPKLMAEQHFSMYPRPVQNKLISCYYEFDDIVMKEIIGKRLSKKNRKDIDDIAEKTQISLLSCRRQFDNLQNIYRHIEEDQGCLFRSIEAHFLLPEEQAKRYAHLSFLCDHRFETGKRRLAGLSLGDFEYVASIMMDHWAEHSGQMDLSAKFVGQVRDLKTILSESKVLEEYKSYMASALTNCLAPDAATKFLQKFSNFMRELLGLGAGLATAKEFRDFFVELHDVTEMLKKMGLKVNDIEHVFNCLLASFSKLKRGFSGERKDAWSRYLMGVRLFCVRIFYRVG